MLNVVLRSMHEVGSSFHWKLLPTVSIFKLGVDQSAVSMYSSKALNTYPPIAFSFRLSAPPAASIVCLICSCVSLTVAVRIQSCVLGPRFQVCDAIMAGSGSSCSTTCWRYIPSWERQIEETEEAESYISCSSLASPCKPFRVCWS